MYWSFRCQQSVAVTQGFWSRNEAKVNNVNLRCEAVVNGLSGGVRAGFNLTCLIILGFNPFNVVKEIQIFEPEEFSLVPFALCINQLLLSQLEKLLYFVVASLVIKSLYRT